MTELETDSSDNDGPPWLAMVKAQAVELGLVNLGITPAVHATGFAELIEWIESGYAASMDYFANRLDAYRHPDGVMPGVQSILVFAWPYPTNATEAPPPGNGRVARYAWSGVDYHDSIHRMLKSLARTIKQQDPQLRTRGCVDTAPLLERELGQAAGLGWLGKNTLLLNRDLGSYFFLCCLMVDCELPYDDAFATSHCGSCTACLDQCPTDAFVEPGLMDAGKCISYLTIEYRGAIDPALRPGMGEWVFGCDVCQEVCPWNRKPAKRAQHAREAFPVHELDLLELFALDEESFRAKYRKSPFWRTRLQGMQRNAAIVLGNQKAKHALPVLTQAANGEDSVVAEACRWAIQEIESASAD